MTGQRVVRIGLLGASKIAPLAIIEPALKIEGVEVHAVAARSKEKAVAFARKHNIANAVAGYEALVARDDVDLIYNALPPSGHLEWTVKSLRAGKHILCEKPFSMNAAEARFMVQEAAASDLCLIEGFHYRYHPLMEKIQSLLPEIGAIEHIDAFFGVSVRNKSTEFRYQAELGGGATMDLGCYPIHLIRTIVGQQPSVTNAIASRVAAGVDRSMDISLAFDNGVTGSASCSMHLAQFYKAKAIICGSTGSISINNFLHPWMFHKVRLESNRRKWRGKAKGGESTFFYQLEHTLGVLAGKWPALTGGSDAIENMQIIEEAYRQAGFSTRGRQDPIVII